jgi:hypothetical protein
MRRTGVGLLGATYATFTEGFTTPTPDLIDVGKLLESLLRARGGAPRSRAP